MLRSLASNARTAIAAGAKSVMAVTRRRPARFLLVLFLGVGLAGSAKAAGPAATLPDLQSVDQFKALFNQDSGMPRLVLLLSPT